MPDLAAYQGGVYVFPFYGDETYTDPYDSSVWTWEGVTNDVEEVLGVSQEGNPFISTTSIADCIALDGTFYWDDANGHLYVHWIDSVGDWSVAKQENRFAKIINGFSSGYNKETCNVFDGQYYQPIITGLSGLSTKVDPTKLGLISFDNSSITLTDQENVYANVNKEDVVGVPIWIYYSDKNTLENDDRIFTGFLNGIKHDRDSVTFNIIQSRLFENKPVCKNSISLDDFPDAGDQEGKLKPTAWGDVRKGKLVPVNPDTLTTAASGSAVLLLADPALGSLRAISKIYDNEDNEVTIDSFDLTACTATITKAADISVSNLKKYKWGGEGYDIPGTYNNGLDIIKHAFFEIARIPFLDSTYDQGQWNEQTTKNSQAVGISIQSDKGFIEELVEPIMTSTQGVLQTLGDGRISYFSRDVNVDLSEEIDISMQAADPTIEESTKELVSEIVVEYSRDFVAKDSLQYIFRDNTVVGKYGVDKREPLSPVKTILVNESDAQAVAEEIAETSTDPQRLIGVTKTEINKDIKVFDVVSVDTGEFGNESIEYGEILSINPDYLGKAQTYSIRALLDYVPLETIEGFTHSNGFSNYTSFGIDGHGIFEVRRSY